jgi:cell division protein FtsL
MVMMISPTTMSLFSLFIYVLTQQTKGQLWSKHEQIDKQNKHTNKHKKGNVPDLDNNLSIITIIPAMMWWEEIIMYMLILNKLIF